MLNGSECNPYDYLCELNNKGCSAANEDDLCDDNLEREAWLASHSHSNCDVS